MTAKNSPVTALDPTVCAEGSLNQLADDLPSNAPYYPHGEAWALLVPCRWCGHGGCLPQVPCQLCRFEIRLQTLEQR